MCEHKIVLAIYIGQPHREFNISHFRCMDCRKTDTFRFGEKIIFDHESTVQQGGKNERIRKTKKRN